jgi:hypothetical protein
MGKRPATGPRGFIRDQWIAPTGTARHSRDRHGIQLRRRPRDTASITLECGSDPLIANPRFDQAPSHVQRPIRDQWIAPIENIRSFMAQRLIVLQNP